ncbi:HipA domain-containing protein [Cypionkella sp.]|uniref:HipA domain-containing protein n=1 Tax=Cypionkella sp. TaxID=2811411 RepID=UPI00271561AF|nr:HipA domain-containing protein [Cypionkella sp.]MDO8984371.1 HipA domain-containing protein [Cypionkella sp.]MDP2048044.1 HipA domain-containing protein [Cypionkella sp.]
MSQSLDVYIESEPKPAGTLSGDDFGTLSFCYDTDAKVPISISMPLREEPYGDVAARVFFDNLLQENDQLDGVMQRHAIARSDVAGLLYHLGRDCAGAISCVPRGSGPGKIPGDLTRDYDVLSNDDMIALMQALAARRPLPMGLPDPSPVAGVQSKIALTRLPDGRFGLPKPESLAPTTHLLKVPRPSEDELVDHEHALMALAGRVLRSPVAQTEIFELGGQRGLLVERFDRVVQGTEVRRLHQEDFCQALGLPSSLKYERNSNDPTRSFSAGRVGALMPLLGVPALDRNAFRAMTLLNLALGNTDNHAKNHALLYRNGTPRLAPLYDVVPVLVDPRVTHDFAFSLGRAGNIDALTLGDMHLFDEAIGIPGRGSRAFERRSHDFAQEILSAVAAEIDSLQGPRLKILGDMVAHQLAILNEVYNLDLDIPLRDAFLIRGGGFDSSS